MQVDKAAATVCYLGSWGELYTTGSTSVHTDVYSFAVHYTVADDHN